MPCKASDPPHQRLVGSLLLPHLVVLLTCCSSLESLHTRRGVAEGMSRRGVEGAEADVAKRSGVDLAPPCVLPSGRR